jgi:hypothetical protein
MWLRMIAGGGGGGLTLEQPENNIVRGAYYALIAALSGAQTMALCCYDEAYTIPSEYAQRISLRTMQLLVEEMGLADTVDPLGGSFYVETLTNRMRAEMERIVAETDARRRHRQARERGRDPVAGVGAGLPHAAGHRVGRLPQGRRQPLPQRRGREPAGRDAPVQGGGREGAGGVAGRRAGRSGTARPSRVRWPASRPMRNRAPT